MIEKEDRKILRSFLKTLVAQDDLGYVLLGEKPAVLYGYIDHLSWRNPITYIGSLKPYKSWGNQYKKRSGKHGENILLNYLIDLFFLSLSFVDQ